MAQRGLAIFRRRLFTVLTILSLLLCLATIGLWMRSYWRADKLVYDRPISPNGVQFIVLQSDLDEIALLDDSRTRLPNDLHFERALTLSASRSSPRDTFRDLTKRHPTPRPFSALGFGLLFDGSGASSDTSRLLWFPHWFLALVFAIGPALRLRSILRTRREGRLGLCPHCGYDLRATPDRCPECGRQPLRT